MYSNSGKASLWLKSRCYTYPSLFFFKVWLVHAKIVFMATTRIVFFKQATQHSKRVEGVRYNYPVADKLLHTKQEKYLGACQRKAQDWINDLLAFMLCLHYYSLEQRVRSHAHMYLYQCTPCRTTGKGHTQQKVTVIGKNLGTARQQSRTRTWTFPGISSTFQTFPCAPNVRKKARQTGEQSQEKDEKEEIEGCGGSHC